MKTFAEIYESMKDTHEYQVQELSLAFTESVLLRMEELNNMQGKELAKRIGCSKAYVSKLLTGKGNFTLDTLVKLARALNCRVEAPALIPSEKYDHVVRFERSPVDARVPRPPADQFVRAYLIPLVITKEQSVQHDSNSHKPDIAAAA